jgi:hypothetical protein
MGSMVPSGSGGRKQQVAFRVPQDMLKRIDRVAKKTHNTRTAAVLHLLRFALEVHEKSEANNA